MNIEKHYLIDDDDLDEIEDKTLLWMIHRDMVETRKLLRNIWGVVAIFAILWLLGVVLVVAGSLSSYD